jgi:ethanolamine utilization protein EutN
MGQTFLVVQTADGEIVAADHVGAGNGDRVLVVTGTVASKFSMESPVDAAVVAILDQKE